MRDCILDTVFKQTKYLVLCFSCNMHTSKNKICIFILIEKNLKILLPKAKTSKVKAIFIIFPSNYLPN